MVSKASDDFPEPETPLTTVNMPCGISQAMFFRLCVRAPRITIASLAEVKGKTPSINSQAAHCPVQWDQGATVQFSL